MRIFYQTVEITEQVKRLDTTKYAFSYTAGQFIYIATDFPFNHLHIKMGVLNAVSVVMKVEYYGNGWVEVVELRDGTNGFKKDGYIEFTPNKSSGWERASDSSTVGQSKVVYDKFWTRLSFDLNLTAAAELSFMGHKFSDDSDLYGEFPLFDNANYKTAFKAGKTDWEEQSIIAAGEIARDLQKKGILFSPHQILERNRFTRASVSKTAEIIFGSFGNDYAEQRKAAREEYIARIDLAQYAVDKNADAILQPSEGLVGQGWLHR